MIRVETTKRGTVIVNEVSKLPALKTNKYFKVPDFGSMEESYISLSLEQPEQSRRYGIRVVSKSPLAVFESFGLYHAAYQGTRPAVLTWEKLSIKNTFNIFLENALPLATHLFYVKATNNGKDFVFKEVSISTPDDPYATDLDAILADDTLSKSEKPLVKLTYESILVEQTALISSANYWVPAIDPEKTAYNTAVTNLTNFLTALNPAYTDFTQNTPLGTGGGASLRTLFKNVNQKRQELQAKIDIFVKTTLTDIFSDNKITPNEKVKVKVDYDNIKIEQGMSYSGLDALALQFSVSSAAYDNTVTALETHLATLSGWNNTTKDWTDYSTTQDLGTGVGNTLRTKFADILRAKADLVKAIDDARATWAATQGAVTGVASVTGLPTLPNAAYPSGKLVYNTVNKCIYRSTGSAWENAATLADSIVGQLTAGQILASGIATSSLNFDTLTSGNYAETSGYATAGFKFDKAADVLKVGPNGLMIGPYVFNQSSLKVNKVLNGNFIKGINPWNMSNGNGITLLDNITGSGVNVVSINPNKGINSNTGALQITAQSAVSGVNGFLGIALTQYITTPKVPSYTTRLAFTIGYYRETAYVNANTSINVYITNALTGTRSQVTQASLQGTADTVLWQDYDIDISTIITGQDVGEYLLEFNISTTAEPLKLGHSWIRNIKLIM